MSTAMTMTLPPAGTTTTTTSILSAATATTTTTTTTITEEPCCPNCGYTLPLPSPEPSPSTPDPHGALLQAQRQIEDLQAQVRLLNQKATAAVDRWADYEDELSRLRAASTSTNSSVTASTKHHATTTAATSVSGSIVNGGGNRPHTPDRGSPRASFLGAGAASRISQLLSPRKAFNTTTPPQTTANTQQQRGSLSSSPSPSSPSPAPADGGGGPGTRELLAALERERALRAAAEERLAATSREVEDLSASLFEEANAMVATERRARAALEERVDLLGRRDGEKRERIGRLEGAVRRLERVRGVLGEKNGVGADDADREKEKERDGDWALVEREGEEAAAATATAETEGRRTGEWAKEEG